ncbi:MAG: WD40 repeat domain-containing protein [Spirochaetaceae bacterium]|nr:WD40 repeat domain-containing protein [Spirochaetaceae bacterium]
MEIFCILCVNSNTLFFGFIVFGLLGGSCLSAQSKPGFGYPGFVSPNGHQGTVTALVDDDRGHILSAGADGFLEIWDLRYDAAIRRFQVSVRPIQHIALRPGTSQISVMENDEIGIYRISVWDYETEERRFSLTFRDTIAYVSYSAAGTYLIAVRSGRAAAVFIHAETGEILRTLDIAGAASFAATGKSERSMITYLPAGILSYWDLETGQEMRHFAVPARMASPVLFGNNRFFAGLSPNGLVILDAVYGTVLVRDPLITRGILLPMRPESSEFMGLSLGAYSSVLYHFTVSNGGKLGLKTSWTIPSVIDSVTSAAVAADAVVLGTAEGAVWTGRRNGTAKRMLTMEKTQTPITGAAASGGELAFLTRNSGLGFIPLDYRTLKDAGVIRLEPVSHTQITAGPSLSAAADQFILWQGEHTRSVPVLKIPGYESIPIGNLALRFPLRSVALLDDKALFLDSLGNIKIISLRTRNVLFSFSLIAALDAVFLNKDNILIGRGAVSGNTPFLMVNITTGETVPLAYPAEVGARVYLGPAGTPYGVAVEQENGAVKTALLKLSVANPALTVKLFECEGEDTLFGLAESGGSAVSALGGAGAFFYRDAAPPAPLDRSPGFPLQLINAGSYLIAVDSEGSLVWHDPETGALLAILRLYSDDTWLLQTADGRWRSLFSGTIER